MPSATTLPGGAPDYLPDSHTPTPDTLLPSQDDRDETMACRVPVLEHNRHVRSFVLARGQVVTRAGLWTHQLPSV